jgi:Na+(H+)/acetate symporter ActP
MELQKSKLLKRVGNTIYWLCLMVALVTGMVGVLTFAVLGGQVAETWAIFSEWALLTAAIFAIGCLVRFFTFRR